MNSVQCNKCGCVVTKYSSGLGCTCGNVLSVEFIDGYLVIDAKDNNSIYIIDNDGGVRFINED